MWSVFDDTNIGLVWLGGFVLFEMNVTFDERLMECQLKKNFVWYFVQINLLVDLPKIRDCKKMGNKRKKNSSFWVK